MEAHVVFNWFWFNFQHNDIQFYICLYSISIDQKSFSNYILICTVLELLYYFKIVLSYGQIYFSLPIASCYKISKITQN